MKQVFSQFAIHIGWDPCMFMVRSYRGARALKAFPQQVAQLQAGRVDVVVLHDIGDIHQLFPAIQDT